MMKQTQVGPKIRTRLSREESRSVTRQRLIEMGRKHFLERGFAGTILEQVAEEAGFSRGALYSNFSGKEELFLAVFDAHLEMRVAGYQGILDRDSGPGTRFGALRKAFVEHVTDKDWNFLRTEFELSAVHSEKLRRSFLKVHRRDLVAAITLADTAVSKGELLLKVPKDEFALAAQSFMIGIALKQRLLGRHLPIPKMRSIAEAFFDSFFTTP